MNRRAYETTAGGHNLDIASCIITYCLGCSLVEYGLCVYAGSPEGKIVAILLLDGRVIDTGATFLQRVEDVDARFSEIPEEGHQSAITMIE